MYNGSVEQWCGVCSDEYVENGAVDLQINLRLSLHLAMSQALASDWDCEYKWQKFIHLGGVRNTVYPLLLFIKRSQLRWDGCLTRMPEVFQPSAAEMRPRADPGQTGDITSLGWLVFIMLVCLFQLFYSENDPDWFHHVNPAQIITWYCWKLRDTRVERMVKEKAFVLWIKAAGCIEEKPGFPC